MKMEWFESQSAWRFVDNSDPAREIWLTNEAAKFISNTLKRDKWRYELMDQCEYDEDNLNFSKITMQEFVDLCLEEIDSNVEKYGDDYEPQVEDIVFDVAHENEIWED